MLDGLHELYEAVCEEKEVQLRLDAPPSLMVFGDRELVQQAVANLLDNAIKFSPPAGNVTITAAAGSAGTTISVADQGPGIPEDDRQRAVERFFRGETARSTPGSGLGLALVQAVAQLHGGSLTLEDANPGLRARLFLSGRERTRRRTDAVSFVTKLYARRARAAGSGGQLHPLLMLEINMCVRIDQIVIQLLDFFEEVLRVILAGLAAIEIWARTQLASLGVPPGISVVILVAIALLLIVAALRLLGPVVYILVMVFIALLMIHAMMPVMVQP